MREQMHTSLKRLRLPENWGGIAEKSTNVSTRAIAACVSVDLGLHTEESARNHFGGINPKSKKREPLDRTPYLRARSVIEAMPGEVRKAFDGEISIYTLWERRSGPTRNVILAERDILFREFVNMLSPEALHAAWRKQAALMSPDRGFDPVKASRLNELWQKIRNEENL
jgi:hypothetical protein